MCYKYYFVVKYKLILKGGTIMKYCMIEVAFDNKKELKQVVSKLLESKLVSGCQVIESDSSWNWNGEFESSKEYLLFMKTKKSLTKKIYEVIREFHNYECFEFAEFDLDSYNKEYLKWIEEETCKD